MSKLPSTFTEKEKIMLTKKKSRRQDNEVNAGSMADIAFLLLIFFLVTTTILEDQGLMVKLPPYEDEPISTPLPDDRVLSILVNYENQLLVENEPMELENLREETKDFILNPQKLPNRPESPRKALISLKNDRGTEYETYLMVYNELQAAYREMRDEEAEKRYGELYTELTDAEKKAIRDDIPMIISEAEPSDLKGK